MSEKITGIVKEIGQFLVGEVVREDNDILVLKNVSMLGISSNGPQVNIQFIPIDLLSMQPPIGIKNLIKDPNVEFEVSFKKADLLFSNLELAENVITNYKTFTGKAAMAPNLVNTSNTTQSPDENIVKLFD